MAVATWKTGTERRPETRPLLKRSTGLWMATALVVGNMVAALREREGGAVYTTMIWTTDGSHAADAALEEALRLAAATGARLLAVHCDQQGDEPGLRERLEQQVASLRAKEVDAELVVESTSQEPWQVVARTAQQRRADLIVCGTRGLGTLSGAFLGSFTQRLLHDAPCPVLVVGPRSRLNEVVAEPREGSAR